MIAGVATHTSVAVALPVAPGNVLAELVPTPKVIAELRGWYPKAKLIGWKYEVDGERANVLSAVDKQMTECRTDACVANGRAYGSGFGLATGQGNCAHHRSSEDLFVALEHFVCA